MFILVYSLFLFCVDNDVLYAIDFWRKNIDTILNEISTFWNDFNTRRDQIDALYLLNSFFNLHLYFYDAF